jgi:hypothetical protein
VAQLAQPVGHGAPRRVLIVDQQHRPTGLRRRPRPRPLLGKPPIVGFSVVFQSIETGFIPSIVSA